MTRTSILIAATFAALTAAGATAANANSFGHGTTTYQTLIEPVHMGDGPHPHPHRWGGPGPRHNGDWDGPPRFRRFHGGDGPGWGGRCREVRFICSDRFYRGSPRWWRCVANRGC